ncbi:MAG: SagB/ThcOx family dehydrogenase [Syntrophales bacterium]|jgi:SagB-type dehydrogenase family enzyme|nr:SagB/ThcOx family dehydrogenase [Syntrophales bacterium]MDY0045401.1 SagB/ThcOx family dehydrogenase [Syntrophales bacterium]
MKFAHCFLFSSLLAFLCAADSGFGAGPAPETITLPQPAQTGKMSVEEALQGRRSVREYQKQPITLSDISQLLWAAQGISGSGRRTAPSAGALYPLEMHAVIGNVTGLSAGVYAYNPRNHELVRIESGDRRIPLGEAALGQRPVKNAAAVIVLAAVYDRTTVKYGERGIRYVHMEAGHAAQNVLLQAQSLGLGSVVIGAFRDEEVKAVAGFSREEAPLYLIPVGRK